MSVSPDKMHEERYESGKERGGVEAGLGAGLEDEKMMRSVVFKMDIRYVRPFPYSVLVARLLRCPYESKRVYQANATQFSLLPILALLFLCSFIDRTNVGNAKILGLEKDIGINDHQYAIGLCVFYATYIARYGITAPAHRMSDEALELIK
jgi:hypothetical protein